jgi:hypothetical protein
MAWFPRTLEGGDIVGSSFYSGKATPHPRAHNPTFVAYRHAINQRKILPVTAKMNECP